jgi:branched-chain amino acid transport system ATP-binding protein
MNSGASGATGATGATEATGATGASSTTGGGVGNDPGRDLLAVRGLCKSFGGVAAVRDVSFDVAAGELLALIGPNGAGKSTTFNMINGQLRPDAGSVRLHGRELAGRTPRRISALGVGRTFQVAATFASLTVLDNVRMALLAHHRHVYAPWRAAATLYADVAAQLLDQVGMGDQRGRACSELAYGDVKRVELAMALAGAPRLLLMDEPTAGMAPRERHALMTLTRGLAARRGMGVLFTEHSMDIVFGYADRIVVLARGQVIAQGAPVQVRTDPRVRELYFGAADPEAALEPAARPDVPAAPPAARAAGTPGAPADAAGDAKSEGAGHA